MKNRERVLESELESFRQFGTPTIVIAGGAVPPSKSGGDFQPPSYVNEFWTSRQRAAHSLHEVSYRACFKPQLPRFFMDRLTQPGETVYDPFMGRGTTLLEAALLRRVPYGCDVNPLSAMLLEPRLHPPRLTEVRCRLDSLRLGTPKDCPPDLLAFYHPETLSEICALREYFLERQAAGILDHLDRWIRMVAINRLSGHSPGFFSVYTLPPNQAVSVARQRILNEQRGQVPAYRPVRELILRKSNALLRDCKDSHCTDAAHPSLLLTQSCESTPEIPSNSVSLIVTSPPFLDVVDYAGDNWLRCWFAGIDPSAVPITLLRKLTEWQTVMTRVFQELCRVLKPGGHVAFEVGEVRGGKLKLEESVIPCGTAARLVPRLVLINAQEFTKTANCWGVQNGTKGTNTNRVVLFRKPD